MRLAGKKVVLVDLDNTLTDTEGNSRRAMENMYEELCLATRFPSFAEFWTVYHRCNDALWDQYRQSLVTRDELNLRRFAWPMRLMGVEDDQLAQRISDCFYKHFLPQKGVMPGAYELLEYLQGRYRLAVLSNGTKSSQLVKMRVFGFDRYIPHLFLSDDVGYPKPDPRIFRYALAQLGVAPQEAVMIGDDYACDIAGALNAGISAVWYNPTGQPLTAGADPGSVVKELSEIKDLL